MTVVAAEATWTEVGTGAVTGGDGPAVTAVPAHGSVFTVAAEKQTRERKIVHVKLKIVWKEMIGKKMYRMEKKKMESGNQRVKD